MAGRVKVAGQQGIYKRQTKGGTRYDVVISKGRDAQTGKPKQGWSTCDTLKAAKALRAEQTVAQQHGTTVNRSRMTMTELFDQWMQTHGDKFRPTTRAQYQRNFKKHILPTLGHL